MYVTRVGMCAMVHVCGGLRTTLWSPYFSPSTLMYVLGIKLRPPDLLSKPAFIAEIPRSLWGGSWIWKHSFLKHPLPETVKTALCSKHRADNCLKHWDGRLSPLPKLILCLKQANDGLPSKEAMWPWSQKLMWHGQKAGDPGHHWKAGKARRKFSPGALTWHEALSALWCWPSDL